MLPKHFQDQKVSPTGGESTESPTLLGGGRRFCPGGAHRHEGACAGNSGFDKCISVENYDFPYGKLPDCPAAGTLICRKGILVTPTIVLMVEGDQCGSCKD